MAITFHSTNRLAIKGRMTRPARNEAFVQGTINGPNMTLMFASQERVPRTPGRRKWMTKIHTRFVKCVRVNSPSGADFWWEGVQSTVMTIDGSLK